MRKTLVLGASENPARYAYIAMQKLRKYNHEVVALGLKKGRVGDVDIETGLPEFTGVHTVTLYINPQRQKQYYDYILSLKPERVIFNPGTENPELEQKLEDAGIEPLEACTLVLLSIGAYE
jgi:uncharacterized protein